MNRQFTEEEVQIIDKKISKDANLYNNQKSAN